MGYRRYSIILPPFDVVWPGGLQAIKYEGGQMGKKIIDMPGGQIIDPSSGKHYFLPFLPVAPLSPSRTLEGLFELTRCLDSPRALLPEIQDTRTPSGVPC